MKYWLLKTEKNTYSIDDLRKEGVTSWDGVRNFQARNNLKSMKVHDLALIYHSGDERAVVGIGEVTKEAYPDGSNENWVAVGVSFKEKFSKTLELKQIKKIKELANLQMLKQPRLSVFPLSKEEWKTVLELCQ